ncbi:MAG TPA: T9SS type A sorting domain-containing protein [Bacteroidia bacterium]|nr:T9SS type A sorting domain-containing protein [Bacteroidia bacterium]
MVIFKRLLVAVAVCAGCTQLFSQNANPSLWIPNGPVSAVALKDSTLFVGGDFSMVSPVTGCLVPFDTANASAVQPYPLVYGRVNCICRDSAGYVYVGGKFSRVGNVSASNLFRFTPSGQVDLSFMPNPNGEVFCIENFLKCIFIGGDFTNIFGQTRGRGARIDSLGELTDFDPRADNTIYAFWPENSNVIAGGQFTAIGGYNIPFLGMLDTATGSSAFANNLPWQCSQLPNGPVRTIRTFASNIIIGGDFTALGSLNLSGLAIVKSNGVVNTSLIPLVSGKVRTMEFVNGKIFIGGTFTSVRGNPRQNLACIDTSMSLYAWNPSANGTVNCVRTADGVNFCIGGNFSMLGTDSVYHAGFIDSTGTGTIKQWNAKIDGPVNAMLPGFSGNVLVGGEYSGAGGVDRENLCAIPLSTLRPDSWHPLVASAISAMTVDHSDLYIAGNFAVVDQQARNGIASYDLATRTVTTFNPGVSGNVRTMDSDDTTLFIGGNFTQAGGQQRNNIAAIKIASQSATPWNPNCQGTVNRLIANGNYVYVAGFYSSIGAYPRKNLSRLSKSTGVADGSWSADTDDGIYDMEIAGGNVYFGGWFSDVAGQPRNHVAAVDTLDGTVQAFNPGSDAYVHTMTHYGSDIFFSGMFTVVNNSTFPHLCDYDYNNQQFDTWNPAPDVMPVTMAANQDWLFTGGGFETVSGIYHPNLSMIAITYVTGVPYFRDENSSIRLWPDPSDDIVNFDLPSPNGTSTVSIFNATGQLVYREKQSGKMATIPVSGFAPGFYSVVIEGENGEVSRTKFIRE